MQKNRFLRITFGLVVIMAITLMVTSVALAVGDTTAPVVTNVVPADGSSMYTNSAGTIYYQSGNSTPMVIRADYSDEAGGSGIDTSSVMVHLDVANMLMSCTVTATHVDCPATATDLYPGLHSIDVYVYDMAGNEMINRTYVTVVVDAATPTYSGLAPANGSTILTSQLNSTSTNDPLALRFDYDIADAAPSSGWFPMSHVNDTSPPSVMGAMISNSSCTKTPSVNPAHYSCQANRAKLLHLGDNTLRVFLKDNVGNSNYADSLSNENHYTVVDDVVPVVSGVTANPTTITASYSDPEPVGRPTGAATLASGINSATAMVHVDGAMIMMGCTATSSSISCPTPSGLSNGDHLVEVCVTDNAGNESMETAGTLTICNPAKPNLALTRGAVSWGSYANYTAGLLTVNLIITNNGASTAYGVTFTGSTANNGVTLHTGTPWTLTDLSAGASVEFPVVYNVPPGTSSFKPSVTASATDACGTGYTYP